MDSNDITEDGHPFSAESDQSSVSDRSASRSRGRRNCEIGTPGPSLEANRRRYVPRCCHCYNTVGWGGAHVDALSPCRLCRHVTCYDCGWEENINRLGNLFCWCCLTDNGRRLDPNEIQCNQRDRNVNTITSMVGSAVDDRTDEAKDGSESEEATSKSKVRKISGPFHKSA